MDENLVANKKSWRPEYSGKELKPDERAFKAMILCL